MIAAQTAQETKQADCPKETEKAEVGRGETLRDEELDAVAGGVIYREHEHIYRNGQEQIGKVLGYLVANDDDVDESFELTNEADAVALADKLDWQKEIIDI